MGGASSIPSEEAGSRLPPTEQRQIPQSGSQPSECPMHFSNTDAAPKKTLPSECPMHVEPSPQIPSGCPMHTGESKENDIDPMNMVQDYFCQTF